MDQTGTRCETIRARTPAKRPAIVPVTAASGMNASTASGLSLRNKRTSSRIMAT
jgi:hypothetical protein